MLVRASGVVAFTSSRMYPEQTASNQKTLVRRADDPYAGLAEGTAGVQSLGERAKDI